jgi:crotonobetainyl-CoA:carnitine CoA-transferase CaiB-like acyl-CoA transferase
VGHREELVRALTTTFRTRGAEHWLSRLQERGVPSGKVRGVREAFEAAAAAGRPATVVTEHPTIGALPLPASPIELEPPMAGPPSPPPLLGEHTEEVLRELGIEPGELISAGIAAGYPPSG